MSPVGQRRPPLRAALLRDDRYADAQGRAFSPASSGRPAAAGPTPRQSRRRRSISSSRNIPISCAPTNSSPRRSCSTLSSLPHQDLRLGQLRSRRLAGADRPVGRAQAIHRRQAQARPGDDDDDPRHDGRTTGRRSAEETPWIAPRFCRERIRHCEERSEEAIRDPRRSMDCVRFARNNGARRAIARCHVAALKDQDETQARAASRSWR